MSSGMVVATAGRRIDAPDAAAPRFPLSHVARVRAAIRTALHDRKATALIASAACGSDLLALDEAGALGLERRIILPFDAARFRSTSVVDRPGDWGALYDRVLSEVSAAGNLVTMRADEMDDDAAYLAATALILDDAIEVAGGRGESAAALVIWDGKSRGPLDLTEIFRDQARTRGLPLVEVLTI